VAWYANREGASVHSLDLQLSFIGYELETFSQSCNESHRIAYAKAVLTAYGGE
jgi:hypothetical protein